MGLPEKSLLLQRDHQSIDPWMDSMRKGRNGVVCISVTSLATQSVTLCIRFIAFNNEQSVGYAASAYGYLTGRPGILLTISGPGCVYDLAGISNAFINTWPMVMISGSCDQNYVGKGDSQELIVVALDIIKFFFIGLISGKGISMLEAAEAIKMSSLLQPEVQAKFI
ncbi:hypothetical protein M8C21_023553 [Ambrosia artemisiifolia]|uniref:Thiamine pyrophosphate enzyme N-terminal TPP-binding domain-containing protein n=1 Tax=Ambrosia artemisiifolia TaxID=4212 RepID=A0AAD5G6R1_AMBAR|nr:hypothetical protein M8C21_023553 [Ambrosia artemisiifolia]